MFWENGAWPNIFTLLLKLYSYFLRQYNENFVLLQKKNKKKNHIFYRAKETRFWTNQYERKFIEWPIYLSAPSTSVERAIITRH